MADEKIKFAKDLDIDPQNLDDELIHQSAKHCRYAYMAIEAEMAYRRLMDYEYKKWLATAERFAHYYLMGLGLKETEKSVDRDVIYLYSKERSEKEKADIVQLCYSAFKKLHPYSQQTIEDFGRDVYPQSKVSWDEITERCIQSKALMEGAGVLSDACKERGIMLTSFCAIRRTLFDFDSIRAKETPMMREFREKIGVKE